MITYRFAFMFSFQMILPLFCRACVAWQKVQAVISTVAHQKIQLKHATTVQKSPQKAARMGKNDTKEKKNKGKRTRSGGKEEEEITDEID